MAKSMAGIDIGASRLKIALCSDGIPRKMAEGDIPENLIRDGQIVSPEAAAQLIKKAASDAKIKARACGVVLPASVVFTRTMTLPVMTHENMKKNLPYEFRDFIAQEKDRYFYDYAVLDTITDEDGRPAELELIAAATLKETIRDYTDMCRRAGFKLVTAIPEELSFMNLIRRYEWLNPDKAGREICFIDLGHTSTKLYIYKGHKFRASRVVDYGMQMLDTVIAESLDVDEHIAREYKHANTGNVLTDEPCMNVYSLISVEVMRAINFYRFNTPDSDLAEIFLCGGGANIEPLAAQLSGYIGVPLCGVSELVGGLRPFTDNNVDAALCAAAVGLTMQ